VFVLDAVYAYLLGVYLGDGWLSSHRGKGHRLRVALDARYPRIVSEVVDAMQRQMPGHSVDARLHSTDNCVIVGCYGKKWFSLLPQHGPGPKHTRSIRLEPWQKTCTARYPEAFVRGLLQTDGSRYTARVRAHGKIYSYTRYSFSNRSEDIKALLCEHLDLLGVRWTRPNEWQIAIARQSSVALVDQFVGPKR
jgi:hypothetical protein